MASASESGTSSSTADESFSGLVTAEIEEKRFAKGRIRNIYKGIYTEPPALKGKGCVIKKEYHDEMYRRYPEVWTDSKKCKTVTEIHSKAKNLAEDFNLTGRIPIKIKFANSYVGKVKHGDEIFTDIIEDYLGRPIQFWNFTNNYGYQGHNATLSAFMHWSWIHSKGDMIADLQGIISQGEFILTDPAIMSTTQTGGKYGPTDTGAQGIVRFFVTHQCTKHCKHLPKPQDTDLERLLPDGETLQSAYVDYSMDRKCHTFYTYDIEDARRQHLELLQTILIGLPPFIKEPFSRQRLV